MFNDSILDLAISPNFVIDGTCFVAKRSGLYRSSDYGKTWTSVYRSLKTSSMIPTLSVCLSPSFEQDQIMFSCTEGGIFRSEDGGRTWEFRVLDSPPPLPIDIEISPHFQKDGRVFVATLDDGLYLSEDFGLSWTAWNFGLFDLHINCLAISSRFHKDRTVYIGTESGLYSSSNCGKSWAQVAQLNNNGAITDIAILSHEEEILMVVVDHHNLWYSKDRGINWTQIESIPPGDIERVILIPHYHSPLIMALISGQIWCLENFASSFYQFF